jgi:RNA polymerase sigma factor (sigma-70 family)
LFTVARHLYVSFNRSRLLEDSAAVSLLAVWPLSLGQASPFEAVAAGELERRIERALAALPSTSREVLLLVGVVGLSHSDAADVCGITPEALRQRRHRAREALANALDRDAATEPTALGGTASCPSR